MLHVRCYVPEKTENTSYVLRCCADAGQILQLLPIHTYHTQKWYKFKYYFVARVSIHTSKCVCSSHRKQTTRRIPEHHITPQRTRIEWVRCAQHKHTRMHTISCTFYVRGVGGVERFVRGLGAVADELLGDGGRCGIAFQQCRNAFERRLFM